VAIGGDNTNSEFGGAGSGGGLALRAVPTGLMEHITLDDNQAFGGAGTKRGGYAAGGGLFTYRSTVWGSYITITNNTAGQAALPAVARALMEKGQTPRAEVLPSRVAPMCLSSS